MIFFFFKLIPMYLLVFIACLWEAWNLPVHLHVPLSLGAVTPSCHVFCLLWHFLLSVQVSILLSRICCALTTGFPYVLFCFLFFHFIHLCGFFPLCVDGLHISSPEFLPEPQTHIFRCYSWSHLHNLQRTLTYRCEPPLTHRDTHIHNLFQIHVSFFREWSVYPAIQSRNHFQTLPFPSLTPVPPCPFLSNTIILVQGTLCVLKGTVLPKWFLCFSSATSHPRVIFLKGDLFCLAEVTLNVCSLPLFRLKSKPLLDQNSLNFLFCCFFLISKFQSTLNLKSFRFIGRVVYAVSHCGPLCIFFSFSGLFYQYSL